MSYPNYDNVEKVLGESERAVPRFSDDPKVAANDEERYRQAKEKEQETERQKQLKMHPPNPDSKTFISGAKSSTEKPRYDMIPRALFERLAVRCEIGLRHGWLNYREGFSDEEFIRDRINHIQEHWLAFLHPRNEKEYKDDNLAAIAWGVGILMELEESGEAGKTLIRRIIGKHTIHIFPI